MTDELGKRLSALSPDRIQALVQKLGRTSAASASRVPKMPRNPEQRYPLSSAQERMWFLSRLSPNSRALNNPAALRATRDDPLNQESFGEAVREVARRHEILRTTFHAEQGRPWQVVHEHLPPDFTWHDLRDLPDDVRERRAEEIALSEGRRAFDLETGPLLAFTIVQLGDTEYLLLNTTHHIVSDGWTNAMLSKEVAAAYAAHEASVPNPLPEPAYQYVDYVAWEEEWLKSDQASEQLQRWKERLADDVPMVLPTDHARPGVMSGGGGMETLRLQADLTERLQAFARQERASLFHLLMAAFSALLFRYSGQDTITVGTQTANRNLREFQEVMGLFINTVVVRSRVDGSASFREYLAEVRARCQAAVRDQEYPFAQLIGALNPHRTLNTHPVFQVMLVHQNVPDLYEVPGMRLEVLKLDYGTAKFDLNLWTEEIGDELALTLHFSRDVFEAETARRLLRQYRLLLEDILVDAAKPVDELALESQPAVTLVAEGAEPEGETPAETRTGPEAFHRRFEEQVARTPDLRAVEGRDGSLTYGELDGRANQLARHIREIVGHGEEPVGILLSRSTRVMVGILGILKAGRAYLALDPAYPVERMAAVLRDAGVTLLLSENDLRSQAECLDASVVYLDADEDSIGRHPVDVLDVGRSTAEEGDALAYIVYTSGSTGLPKGVGIEHRCLVRYCEAIWPVLDLDGGCRFATVTSVAADLGNTMIFPPLLNGGCVVLVPDDTAMDPVELACFLDRHAVDCIKMVPSHARAMLAGDTPPVPLPRRLLVLGGEVCPPDLVDRVRALAPNLRVMNHYGPSETTVGVLAWEIPPAVYWSGPVPLGVPLGQAQVHVLDGAMRTVPTGIPGEIFIGGPTVAQGYVNRPALTRERFIDDPWHAGGRLYRTGDRAKRRDDGSLMFLGRVDRQIKIRGYRVELGEVESALAVHSEVAQAVVLPPLDDDPRQFLRAYVHRRAGSSVGVDDLTASLRRRLPAHMIPALFTFLDGIPLTGNGKIDYGALAEHRMERVRTDHSAPRDTVELELVRIWRELLGTDEVGIDDGFFDLGGHSLLAVQLMAEIHDCFGEQLPLATLFEHGTVRSLANLIRAEGRTFGDSPLVPIRTRGRGAPLFFVHPAGGNVLCYYELSRALGERFPFWGIQATPTESSEPQANSIQSLAGMYLEAIPEALLHAVPVLGGWSMGALVAFEMARLLNRKTGHAPTVMILDQLAPGAETDAGASSEDATTVDLRVSRLLAFADKVSELVGEDVGVVPEALAGQSAAGQAAVMLERFKAYDLAPETTRAEDFRAFLDLMLDHNRITAEYSGDVYPGRLVVFRAEARMSGGAGGRVTAEPDLGWHRFSSAPVEVVSVPGSHVSMIRSPHVATLAERLSEALEEEA